LSKAQSSKRAIDFSLNLFSLSLNPPILQNSQNILKGICAASAFSLSIKDLCNKSILLKQDRVYSKPALHHHDYKAS